MTSGAAQARRAGPDIGDRDLLPAGGLDAADGQARAVLSITGLSKSQVSEMAKDLDEHVKQFRTRRLEDAGPFTFVAADALVLKVREGGRVVGVHALVARGLSGVKLVTSAAHAGLVAAIGATIEGAARQRCRTHYSADLMSVTPKSSWPWVKALLHSIYDQPDADAVQAQFDRVITALKDKLPAVAENSPCRH